MINITPTTRTLSRIINYLESAKEPKTMSQINREGYASQKRDFLKKALHWLVYHKLIQKTKAFSSGCKILYFIDKNILKSICKELKINYIK
jgi:hypothetical protein